MTTTVIGRAEMKQAVRELFEALAIHGPDAVGHWCEANAVALPDLFMFSVVGEEVLDEEWERIPDEVKKRARADTDEIVKRLGATPAEIEKVTDECGPRLI